MISTIDCGMKLLTYAQTPKVEPLKRHFADDIFKCIFLNENVWIPVKISLKYVPKGPINNIPALVYRRIYASLGLNELNGGRSDSISAASYSLKSLK